MSNLTEKENKITVTPIACPVYSTAIHALGASPLARLCIGGLDKGVVNNISINVYGLSKAGFFIERTSLFAGEIVCEKGSDTVYFDFSRAQFSVKKDFFRNLKAAVPGKLCAEVTIDGTKYMGDAQMKLLPANVYPSDASPLVFASLLSPFNSEIAGFVASPASQNFSGLYDALRSRRIVYSVRDCDFISHDVAFESMESIFSKRTIMVSPLEMAFIYCSCALRAGMHPAVAVLKGKKAPRILCGVVNAKDAFALPVCTSSETLKGLYEDGKISLFDVSCLFTGHSIELEDATRDAYDKLLSEELVFAVDICSCYSQGVKLVCHDDKMQDACEKFLSEFTTKRSPSHKDLSALAESLCDSERSPLLKYPKSSGVAVSFADATSVSSFACSGQSVLLSSTSVSSPYEHEDFVKKISSTDKNEKGELYLACGFLRSSSIFSPVALYPVKLCEEKEVLTLEFLSPKPYLNRLICEKLKESSVGKEFFEKYGLPTGNIENITDCFESFCKLAGNEYSFSPSCRIAKLPLKDSLLSFYMIDRYERIVSDPLSCALLDPAETKGKLITCENVETSHETAFSMPDLFTENELAAAEVAKDCDLILVGSDFKNQCRISTAVACHCLKNSKRAVIVSENKEERRSVLHEFKKLDLDGAVLVLSQDTDIKESIKNKLISLSQIPMPLNLEGDDKDICELRDKFIRYNTAKNKRYLFDFSFNEAAKAYINAGNGLSSDEKKIHLEPDTIFFPDMSRESTEAIFASLMALCRAAAKLSVKGGFSKHPLFRARLTDEIPDSRTFVHLASNCEADLTELTAGCKTIAKNTGFDLSHLKNLPSVHAFLSLNVLISNEYDREITKELLCCDIYSVSKKITNLRALSSKIAEYERELCEFEKEIFDLEAEELFVEWTSKGEMSHSEITKKINEYRKADIPSDIVKKTIPEALSLLAEREKAVKEFSSDSENMPALFGSYWKEDLCDWNKISKLVDFVKMADVLLKKIYGIDAESRHAASETFCVAYDFCSDKINMASVIGTAGVFDRMFSDDGGFVNLSKMIGADLYNMNFDEGIFSEGGIGLMLSDWKGAADEIVDVAHYNKCASECEKRGLSCFVKYLENESVTNNTEKIFTRSLLFLALKQISLNDRSFYIMSDYSHDAAEYSLLAKEKAVRNLNARKLSYVKDCVEHINSNSERSKAFSASLEDKRVSAEELILRHSDTIKTLFPVIVAEPYYAGILSDYENMLVLSSHLLPTAKILPVLNVARHKLFFAGEMSEKNESVAKDVLSSGVTVFDLRAGIDGAIFGNKNIEFKQSPLSSFDKERHTNVLEAQTVGLEILKALEADSALRIRVVTFTENQCHAIAEVLSAVSEKSDAVAKALASGMIEITYAGQQISGYCDILFVSTVYGKDDISGGCITCALIDDNERITPAGFELASYILESGAERTIVISSFSCDKHPETAGAHGAARLFAFSGISRSGGRVIRGEREFSDRIYDIYLLEFCRLMTENGIDVKTIENKKTAVITIGGREYAVITETPVTGAAYERARLKRAGYDTLFIDKTDVVMNGAKIVDKIKKLEEENA